LDPSTPPTAAPVSNVARAVAYVRANGWRIATEALVNFIGPYVIFQLAKPPLGEVNALIASSAPPILWSIVEFVRRRRVDALSILVLVGIALGLLAFVGGGGVKFLQLREKLVTVAIGLIFLGSAAIGRPLMYVLARASMMRTNPAAAKELEDLKDNVYFRRTMTTMTLVWGFGLVGEAALAGALVFALTVSQFLIVSPIIGYSTMGALFLWTFWYARRARRRGDERRAAEAAAALQTAPETPAL
jgi:hypothetical protein